MTLVFENHPNIISAIRKNKWPHQILCCVPNKKKIHKFKVDKPIYLLAALPSLNPTTKKNTFQI